MVKYQFCKKKKNTKAKHIHVYTFKKFGRTYTSVILSCEAMSDFNYLCFSLIFHFLYHDTLL